MYSTRARDMPILALSEELPLGQSEQLPLEQSEQLPLGQSEQLPAGQSEQLQLGQSEHMQLGQSEQMQLGQSEEIPMQISTPQMADILDTVELPEMEEFGDLFDNPIPGTSYGDKFVQNSANNITLCYSNEVSC